MSSATEENVAIAKTQLEEAATAARRKWIGRTFAEFEAHTYREPIEYGKYVVDGDVTIIDKKHLMEFFQTLQQRSKRPRSPPGALVIRMHTGRPSLWNSIRKRQLTYCVSKRFGADYNFVVNSMAEASSEWENAAAVDFSHLKENDSHCSATNPNVLFDVNPVDVDGIYLARAFFPDEQRAARNILIDNSAFQLPKKEALSLTGILRHELGHALGWRHEHTRPDAGACYEDEMFKPITSYDAFSVMHYPNCNGGGDWSLNLSEKDKKGSACIYGRGRRNSADLADCDFKMPKAPAEGPITEKVITNQVITKGHSRRYEPIKVKRGSFLTITMEAEGADSGDPDLYVRFLGEPTQSKWVCRPYLSSANEVCELEVPKRFNRAYVTVHGYEHGTYKLRFRYVEPSASDLVDAQDKQR